jgi:Cyclophilin type peptidyl-prolyl cis-trans isomerase/CLD
MSALDGAHAAATALPGGVVIHTTRGDITIKLFPADCPKTVENFTTHARNGYYDSLIVHRVIKVWAALIHGIATPEPCRVITHCEHSRVLHKC